MKRVEAIIPYLAALAFIALIVAGGVQSLSFLAG